MLDEYDLARQILENKSKKSGKNNERGLPDICEEMYQKCRQYTTSGHCG